MPADIHGIFNRMVSAAGSHVSPNHDSSLKGEKVRKNMFCTLAFQVGFLGIGGVCLVCFVFKKRMCLVALCSQLTSSLFYVTMRGQSQLLFLMEVDVSHNNISGDDC